MTPLGRPVVPEVYWTMNRSSSEIGSSIAVPEPDSRTSSTATGSRPSARTSSEPSTESKP